MTRRRFLKLGAAMAGAVLYGCEMSGKKNIKDFGKTFNYLSDPALRKKDMGDAQLVVEGAEFSGVRFKGQEWRNIKFVNCDFAGAYEIKQALIEKSSFEGCKFAGIFNLGVLKQVRFVRCLISGSSHVVGDTGSLDVTFEQCEQIGKDPEPNHWGSFGSYGEVAFIKCKAKWTNVTGETQHLIRDCDFESVDCGVSDDGGGSAVLIENSRLLGDFDMRPAMLLSLTIRDSTIGTLNLSDATVKGDILMERVNAEKMNLAVASGKAINLSGVKISGSGQKVFYLAANRVTSVLLNDCVLPSAPDSEAPWVGGAEQEPAYKSRPPVSQSVTLKNMKASRIDATYLNTARLLVEGGNFQEVDMRNGRIGSLEISNTSIASTLNLGSSVVDSLMLSSVVFSKTLNLSNTQIKEFKQFGGTDIGKLGRNLNKEGSNIKLPR